MEIAASECSFDSSADSRAAKRRRPTTGNVMDSIDLCVDDDPNSSEEKRKEKRVKLDASSSSGGSWEGRRKSNPVAEVTTEKDFIVLDGEKDFIVLDADEEDNQDETSPAVPTPETANTKLEHNLPSTSAELPVQSNIEETGSGRKTDDIPQQNENLGNMDDYEEEDEEESEQEFIPADAIAKLTDAEKVRLEELLAGLREVDRKLAELDEQEPITDDEYPALENAKKKYRDASVDIANQIIKLCKLEEEEFVGDDLLDVTSFRYTKSGHKTLDKILTVLVQGLIGKQLRGFTPPIPKKQRPLASIHTLDELDVKSLTAFIAGVAGRTAIGKIGPHLLSRHTQGPVNAEEVYKSLWKTYARWKRAYFNRIIVPRYTANGDRNPALPPGEEPPEELFRRNGARPLTEVVRDYSAYFEEKLVQRGVDIDRDPGAESDDESDQEGGEDDEDEGEGVDWLCMDGEGEFDGLSEEAGSSGGEKSDPPDVASGSRTLASPVVDEESGIVQEDDGSEFDPMDLVKDM